MPSTSKLQKFTEKSPVSVCGMNEGGRNIYDLTEKVHLTMLG